MITRIITGLVILGFLLPVQAAVYPFTLHKLESGVPGPTILVIGGIQGDEPGGFNAASILVTDYRVTRGEVWVVPNLNFESIIKRSRGVYGDMNRKFLNIKSDDPEFQAIMNIKRIITDNQVDLVLNLHDGSGFYNPDYIDKDENPHRWGQSVVIDQTDIEARAFGNLEEVANNAIAAVNSGSRSGRINFRLKNTRTREGDKEMEKTLTYFAINNGKAAMGVEASKAHSLEERIFNHLRFVEAMFGEVGIDYQRDFRLSAVSIGRMLGQDIQLSLFDDKIRYDLVTPRKYINYVPIKRKSNIEFRTNNPLVAIVNSAKKYKVRFGNRGVTTLSPQYFDYDNSLDKIDIVVDGVNTRVANGSMVAVQKEFMIHPIPGRRVNVIGFRKPGTKNESGLLISKKQILARYSVDQQGHKFRVEFYQQDKYSGMILLDFSGKPLFESLSQSELTATSSIN